MKLCMEFEKKVKGHEKEDFHLRKENIFVLLCKTRQISHRYHINNQNLCPFLPPPILNHGYTPVGNSLNA